MGRQTPHTRHTFASTGPFAAARAYRLLPIVLVCSLWRASAAQDDERPPQPISFVTVSFSRGTLHVDEALRGHGADFAEEFDRLDTELRERRRKLSELRAAAPDLIEEVNTIVGGEPDEVLAARQLAIVDGLTALAGGFVFPEADDAEIWVVERGRGKAFVLAGGELPGVTHDARTGDVSASVFVQRHGTRAEILGEDDVLPSLAPFDQITIPVDEAKPVESLGSLLSTIVQAGGDVEGPLAGAIAHEVAELALLNSIRPADPHWRWFSDGFATAVAEEALRRIGRADDAEAIAAIHDPDRFEDEREATLLRYWPAPDYAVEIPNDQERRLTQARYAFAAGEARRIMREYGVETVARIVADLSSRPANASSHLVAAVSAATGENFADRLDTYQPFRSLEEGRRILEQRYEDVRATRDAEATLAAFTRILEVMLAAEYPPRLYAVAASGLVELGHTDEAVDLMQRQVAQSGRHGHAARDTTIGLLVALAVRIERLEIAYDVVDLVAAADPSHFPVLAVRADRLANEGRVGAASAFARRLLARAPAQLPPHLTARLERIAAEGETPAWRELGSEIDPARDAVAGDWQVNDGRVAIIAAPFARLALPIDPPKDYELDVAFRRHSGRESVNLVLPVGDRRVLLVLDGWPGRGGLTALDLVDGNHGSDNVTTNGSFRIVDRVPHTLHVTVSVDGEHAAVAVTIDGKVYIDWTGETMALDLDERWALPEETPMGIGAFAVPVLFESIRVRPAPAK